MPPLQDSAIGVANIQGRDGSSPRLFIPDERCVEALNVDWFESSLGRRRNGATSVSLTGGTGQSGVISALFAHTPTPDQGGKELWSVDDAATPRFKRLAGGTSWADVTLKDNVSSKPWEINAVTFNGKLFFAYDSTVNRLHVWDGSTVRRAGIDTAAAPTVANTGSGSYAATLRYYKIRWVTIVSSVVTVTGELSPAVSFTPSGSGTAARVTQSTPPGEVETHWEVFGSADGANYFRLAQVAAATTTYDDSTVPSAYSGNIPLDVNAAIAPPSAKYLAADLSRLVMAGAWETAAGNSMTPKTNRYWWTAPLGATDNGDDERVSNTSDIKNYDDIEEDFSGIGGPLNGAMFLFSYGGVWKAVSTPVPQSPYVTIRVGGAQGCIQHKTIVKAEDANGEAALYWLSPIGPCRFGSDGFQRCNEDVDDIWRTVNLSATTIVAHGVFHRDKHQIWWWVATGSSNEPDTRIVFDTKLGKVVDSGTEKSVRKGWSKHTGPSCAARCSVMFSDTIAASMSRTLKPYIGLSTGTAIWKCDTGTTDNGTNYQAYIKTKFYTPWGLGRKGALAEEAVLAAEAGSATIQLTVIRDAENAEPLTSTVSLAAGGTESRVIRQFDDSRAPDCKAIQFQIGDAAAVDASWNLDALTARWVDAGVI